MGFGHEVDHDNSAYDVTISVECFEHDPHWRETFSNMVRMTRPGGLAAFRHTSRGRPARGTISVPIAADQAGRITRCVDRGLSRWTALDASSMTAAAIDLLQAAAGLEYMRSKARAASLQDATRTAIDALDGLLPR